ncbi:TlyA family RNA methyltransferase [Brachybacterium sp. JHP9]|uniref:TlyA family RNA methyltransferase n=1 Tax=Brachybacterium equifaecis TaxID=2910770 RepID=A0ABT0R0U3_9MICO|nr:TlyA family RNA methyltransferase [Brachybacterium equifaecis]MCL6423532.1 TlyA family RNA methyltransferase [Brachybacterium equifaecis]
MSARRLDLALAEEGLARSRTHAQRIIAEGRARVDGAPALKPSHPVPEGAAVEVADVPDGIEYASRAAHKLAGALERLGVDPEGKRCLDAGASSGGFTDVLLRRGAARVIAVDIGRDQLAAHLRGHERLQIHDNTSIRGLRAQDVGGAADLITADLSFISLRTVLGDLAALSAPGADLVLMVKPQFEVGKAALPRTGVVSEPRERIRAVAGVAQAGLECGMSLLGVAQSDLPGQDGNLEYFVHLRAPRETPDAASAVPGEPVLERSAYDMIERAVSPLSTPSAPLRRAPEPTEGSRSA